MRRDPEIIHKTMSRIRGKDTGIELALRKELTARGYRYFVNSKKAFGHPDIQLQKEMVAVFCDSEFWHGYHFDENAVDFHEHQDYWVNKIKRNMARDDEVNQTLTKKGYKVIRFWGKEIEKDLEGCVNVVIEAVEKRRAILARCEGITNKTTLAYIERDDCYLLLYRNKKKQDENQGKWIGIGGHLEEGETHLQAFRREILEETGLSVDKYHYYGRIDFVNMDHPGERMYLFKVTSFHGEMLPCNEGELAWIKKTDMGSLPMWEGDRRFLPLLDEAPQKAFHMLVKYDENGDLEDFIPDF